MISGQPYRDRREAGRVLAAHVREQLRADEPVVLALPRGGVPVGLEVAHALDAPLDVLLVRKLAVPGQPDLAMGAIAAGGYEVLNRARVDELGVTPLQIAAVADRETAELQRREAFYHSDRAPVEVEGRVAVLVDDGLATGCTMRAAIGALRDQGARRVVVAVPVGAADTCDRIAGEVDDVICPLQPEAFHGVGEWYSDFSATTDAEVRNCLCAAAAWRENLHAAPRFP